MRTRSQHKFADVWHGTILLPNSDQQARQQQYWSVLDQQEQAKALALAAPDAQQKYIKTRGVLKHILSRYMQIKASQLRISTTKYGKPFIKTGDNLHFNLSHKANGWVIAVSNASAVGVDIEQNQERKRMPALVGKYFSETEAQFWWSLPKAQQSNMFYQLWVRKEAYVKAVGRGIGLGLKHCVVDPVNRARFLSLPLRYGLASHWKIVEITPNNDAIGALVVANVDFALRQIRWQC